MKKTISVLFCLVLLLPCLFGCAKTPPPSETRTNGYTLYKNILYREGERGIVDLCVPDEPTSEGLILFIHGGGWVTGDKEGYETALKEWAGKGYACAALNYRYISEDVNGYDILDDIRSALQTVKDKLASLGLGCKNVLLTGGSAGAHLSLLYAYAYRDISPVRPAAVISLSGPADLTDPAYFTDERYAVFTDYYYDWFSWLSDHDFSSETYGGASDSLRHVSPVFYVDADTVPTVICHGTLDEIVPYSNAVTLDAELTKYGVPHELITFNDSGHGLENDAVALRREEDLFDMYVKTYLP